MVSDSARPGRLNNDHLTTNIRSISGANLLGSAGGMEYLSVRAKKELRLPGIEARGGVAVASVNANKDINL